MLEILDIKIHNMLTYIATEAANECTVNVLELDLVGIGVCFTLFFLCIFLVFGYMC